MAINYAIVKTGGKQYRVKPGDVITVERLPGEMGSEVELSNVLLVSENDKITVGNPVVDGAKVLAEVTEQARGDKIIVLKYKSKVRYAVKQGHRQALTKISIKDIVGGGRRKGEPSGA
jgi:large subunit ribosomal protein L21